MVNPMTRRDALSQTLLAFSAPNVTRSVAWGYNDGRLSARLAEIDKRSGGRLGCAVLNTSTGAVVTHRGDERFPMCSTFKASAVAFVLQRVDRRSERLDRRIVFSEHDILSHAPITKLHVGGDGMSVADLCAAQSPRATILRLICCSRVLAGLRHSRVSGEQSATPSLASTGRSWS